MAEETDRLVIHVKTLGEVLSAIEGLRGQLSVLSDTALLELNLMKFWIQKAIDAGAAQIALDKVLKN